MWNLRLDAATAEVVEALRRRGVESVVLKGPALNDWYSPDSGRTYVDGDIWVSPSTIEAAETVLRELGFEPTQDESGLPHWWKQHGSSWLRAVDGGKIDLHRRLQGVGSDPEETWTLLWQRAEPLEVAGTAAWRLDTAARALYVTLHAAHHGAGDARGFPHLLAALGILDDHTWAAAYELAGRLDAVDPFGVGLRLVDSGSALARRIGVPGTSSVQATLQGSAPPPVALGFEQLAQARGLGRVEVLLRKAVPPPGFVRHWWPPAARNRRWLIVGYLYRPLWLLQKAPAGFRAWRQARRVAKSSR
jgi:hypothetical protein